MNVGDRVRRRLDHAVDPPARVMLSPHIVVLTADKLHNASLRVTDGMIHGDSTWEHFTGKKDGTIWYYESIIDITAASNAPKFFRFNSTGVIADMGE